MAVVRACTLPEDLHYDVERGVWVRLEPDGTATMGFSDAAQTRAGKILHVSSRALGKTLVRGKTAATIESAKWIGPFPTALSGEVVAVNEQVLKRGITINQDPYGVGWIIRLRPSQLAAELPELPTGEAAVAAYGAKLERDRITCIKCAE